MPQTFVVTDGQSQYPFDLARLDARLNVKLEYGAVGDGAADDTAAIVAARDAAAATVSMTGRGVAVYCPAGVYKTTAELTSWPDKVSLVGDGPGRTIFKPTGDNFRFIGVTRSAGAPLTRCDFRDFELDGSGIATGAATKGIHLQHVKDCKFLNIYAHDCGMTGIGPDFCYGSCVIGWCHVESNGRLNDGTQSSGNGIGIGSLGNATDEEPVTVIACHAINNKRYGIFVEAQNLGNSSAFANGARIEGCYASGNQVGIGDCGNRRTTIVGNACTNNSVAGIQAGLGTWTNPRPGYEGLIASNVCYLNGGDGIQFDYTVTSSSGTPAGRWNIRGNVCGFNTGRGIGVKTNITDWLVCDISDNVVHDNSRSGIRIYYIGPTNSGSVKWSRIKDNFVYNNGAAASAGDRDGIRLDVPLVDTDIDSNYCFDRLGSKQQGYGIVCTDTVTGGSVSYNDCRKNLTGTISFSSAPSATTLLRSNPGYTPPGPTSPSVGASPWTYTASEVHETFFCYGGTVSSITVGGVQVANQSGVVLPLEPGDAVVVTYSVAPTVRSRQRS